MDVLARLDETRSAINVLEHPFYQRWSAGDLSAEELAIYAAEYRPAVVALARASELAAEKAGPAHAARFAAMVPAAPGVDSVEVTAMRGMPVSRDGSLRAGS